MLTIFKKPPEFTNKNTLSPEPIIMHKMCFKYVSLIDIVGADYGDFLRMIEFYLQLTRPRHRRK